MEREMKVGMKRFSMLGPTDCIYAFSSVTCVVFIADEVRNLLGRWASLFLLVLLGLEHAKRKPKQNKYDSCENRND